MTRHADQVVSVLPAVSLVALLSLCATPTLAGDRALIDYLGFSDDGRYFAFEEFGVQDGSGFPYTNIYVIDLPADAWVSGSPYRARIEDDTGDVEAAREMAFELAEDKLEELGIAVAAYPIAVNGDGEAFGDGHGLTFGRPGYGLEPIQNPRELTLETVPLESNMDCSIIDNEVVGFSLSLDGDEVHVDEGPLPTSRGCAMDYRIHAVVTPAEWSGAFETNVAIISTYPFGFEGPDRRFLAVPLPE